MNVERSTEAQFLSIPIGAIQLSDANPRRSFDEAKMEELKASIAQHGIRQPLLMRPIASGGGEQEYELVAGGRRFRAACALGLIEIPAMVREMSDAEAAEIRIVENLQREDVHPVEEAEAYRLLIADSAAHGLGRDRRAEDIARRLGKSTAYVAQRLKLLDLELVAKQMFLEGEIDLAQALLLARLTLVDQERAVRALLGGTGDYAKKTIAEVYQARKTNRDTNSWARTRRIVDMTEAALKQWIAGNVMLKLEAAPWDLTDANLVPEAGACTTCPKRSGSNAALFADLTSDQEVCLDAVCYGVKHKAFVQVTTKKAAAAGEPLLQLTARSGHKKLPEPATEKVVFKSGQWLKAAQGSCPAVRRGIMLDASSIYSDDKLAAGDIIAVCVDQRCKVHKHTVESTVAGGGKGSVAESWEARQEREKKEADAIRVTEIPVLRAVYDAMLEKLKPTHCYLQSALLAGASPEARNICREMGIVCAKPDHASAVAALKKFLQKATPEQMHRVAFHSILIDELTPNDWLLRDNRKRVRAELWGAAEFMGVDAPAIAKRVAKELAAPKAVAAKPAATKKTASESTAKPAVAAKPKKLSPEGRKRIVDNMRKRWAARRKATA